MKRHSNAEPVSTGGLTATHSGRRPGDRRNLLALLSLFCGIAAWVPWVIVFMAPLAWGFALLAILGAYRRNHRDGTGLAVAGASLAAIAVLVHLSLVFVFALVGYAIEFAWTLFADFRAMSAR